MPDGAPAPFNIADEFVSRPAAIHPGKLAILGVEREATYAEVKFEVERVAQALLDSGCKRGDRVLIVLPDSLEFIASFFGAAKIGAIAVPVNSMARAADFHHYLSDSGARFAVVHVSAQAQFEPAIESSNLELVIYVGNFASVGLSTPPRRLAYSDWVRVRANAVETAATTATDMAFLLYTSGSGGAPKAAIHRHGDMLVCARSYAQSVLGLRSDDRTFSVSKLFFAYGLGNGMYFPFSVGAGTVLYPGRPSIDKILEVVGNFCPTIFFSVPTFFAALLRDAGEASVSQFSSVRLAVSAGETLPAEICLRFRERFGIEILDGIGSTEMLHIFISSRPGMARPGSCGMEVPGYHARILDDSCAEMPPGEIGNLWVRGDSAFQEYWNIPQLTARTKKDEWVFTGDKFYRDRDGFYHYCGRVDDMMKVSGMWVSPGEVENALLTHPIVAEAAVVARHDARGLMHPTAYVVLREGTSPGNGLADEIREWTKRKLLSYKCPERIEFVVELPKTATGKIQRFRLRE